jgi:iron complex transport system substrate-binding protein
MVSFGNVLIRLPGIALLVILAPLPAFPEVAVTDDAGYAVVLGQPARRIVSLAPYITELLFAAGAGRSVAGVSEFSDYPEAARRLPRIGGGGGLDLEAILALQPDLVIAWQSGNPAQQVERLRSLGLAVYLSEPRRLEDVPATLERFGRLAGTGPVAAREIAAFRMRLATLRRRYAHRPEISVFYQIWERPLMTVNGEHLISDVIRVCGGRNVFSDLPALAPQITLEAVLAVDPDVMVAGSEAGVSSQPLAAWLDWPELAAVQAGHLYLIPRELLVRHTPRILDGAERLCRRLEAARQADTAELTREAP